MNHINLQPIEKLQVSDGSVLQVHSIFYTIQGEGPFSGQPAVFVRLAGCNLQCPSCDTDYTSDRKEMTVEQIVEDVWLKHDSDYVARPLVVITGGEPFRQNIALLCAVLAGRNYNIQIETNGTLPIPGEVYRTATVVCSPKTGKVHDTVFKWAHAFKYVLSYDSVDKHDGLPILALNHTASPRVQRPRPGAKVYVQPMDAKDDETYVRNVEAVKESCMKHGYTLQLQIHKIIHVE